jgi:hypothetical protein
MLIIHFNSVKSLSNVLRDVDDVQSQRGLALGDMTGVFGASFSDEMGKYCSYVLVEIRKCRSSRVILFGTSPRPDGLGIIAGFGSRITLLGSKNSCETTTPFMSLLLVRVSRGPLCTYPSTLCVYHVPKNLVSLSCKIT